MHYRCDCVNVTSFHLGERLSNATLLNMRLSWRTLPRLLDASGATCPTNPSVTSTSWRCMVETRRAKRCLASAGRTNETSTICWSWSASGSLSSAWIERSLALVPDESGSEIHVAESGAETCGQVVPKTCVAQMGVGVGSASPNVARSCTVACERRVCVRSRCSAEEEEGKHALAHEPGCASRRTRPTACT